MLCVDNYEGARKVLSASFPGIVHAFVHSSLTLQHVTDAISSFEVHQSNEAVHTVTIKAILF